MSVQVAFSVKQIKHAF